MENGNPPKKKSKKKKVRSSSPQTSNGPDKPNYYCAFSSRTARNICEQFDNTEIQPEVYSRLAEDATYKMMELVNNIKVYAKHSGGRATFDLTNEVLKDSNCPPILSADDMPELNWKSVVDDHQQSIFFNRDETLNLTDEFNKHIEVNVNGPVFLSTSFLLDEKIDDDYIEFYNSICDACFTGDEECKTFALNTLSSSPHVAGLVKYFLNKWIRKIALNYTKNILTSSIQFLAAITRNPYANNSDMSNELKLVCQLLVSLLVGSVNDEIRENGHDVELEQEPSDYSTFDSNIVSYVSNNGIMENNNGLSLDEMSSDSNLKAYDESNTMMLENLAMECDKPKFMLKEELLEGFEVQSCEGSKIKLEHHEEVSKDSASSRSHGRNDNEDLNSLTCASTKKCDDPFIDDVCELLGMCSAKWSGTESYLTILLTSEIENFFKLNQKIKTDKDFEWLGRIVRGLWSLGEFAFRELLVFFEKIDTSHATASFVNYFNFPAIYVRGKRDIFFYEFLYEVCGDKVLPFLLYYTNFLLKVNRKKFARYTADQQNENRFKIHQRLKLSGKWRELQPRQPELTFVTRPIKGPTMKAITIRYGHPVMTKKLRRMNQKVDEKRVTKQDLNNVRSFNARIVVAKGRLKKPITNTSQRCLNYHSNLHMLML